MDCSKHAGYRTIANAVLRARWTPETPRYVERFR